MDDYSYSAAVKRCAIQGAYIEPADKYPDTGRPFYIDPDSGRAVFLDEESKEDEYKGLSPLAAMLRRISTTGKA